MVTTPSGGQWAMHYSGTPDTGLSRERAENDRPVGEPPQLATLPRKRTAEASASIPALAGQWPEPMRTGRGLVRLVSQAWEILCFSGCKV